MHVDVGLRNDGEAMTMIPTYVTKVPNGTEEVRIILSITCKRTKNLCTEILF